MNTQQILLQQVEEKISDTKRLIRGCRIGYAWTINFIQGPGEQWEDICFDVRDSLDTQRRYERQLRKYRHRLARYERLRSQILEVKKAKRTLSSIQQHAHRDT